jgi:small subunit ribosomal protein S2
MPSKINMKALLESGVHFGHRSRKWNPKMADFIFAERNGIHILDLQQTLRSLHEIHDRVANEVQRGGSVLFVGTKRQAQDTIEMEANRCHMPYVNQRWLGGTLTNWKTIRQRIEALKRLEFERDEGIFDRLTKKERLMKQREIDRLLVRLGGIRDMERLPALLYIVDVVREYTAVREANVLKIPIIALVDTNSNPDQVDHIIPANDDAIRAIHVLTAAIADAVIEGQNMRKAHRDDDDDAFVDTGMDAVGAVYDDDDISDEAYLGEATLAKLRDSDLGVDDDDNGDLDADDDIDTDDDDDNGDDDDSADDDESADDIDDDDEADDSARRIASNDRGEITMDITAQMVKELRERTGVGPLDCKKALEQYDGDMEQAASYLRDKGLAKAVKKAGRSANEGIIQTYQHHNGRFGVMVEVNCETDFVASTDQFQNFAKDLALHIANLAPEYVLRENVPQAVIAAEREMQRRRALEEGKPENVADKIVEGRMEKFFAEIVLMEQPFVKDDKVTIEDLRKQAVAELGENILIRRFARFALGEEGDEVNEDE